MSTICKLDPRVRMERYKRRRLIAEFRNYYHFIRTRVQPTDTRYKTEAWMVTAINFLEQMIKCPWLSGREKSALCQRLVREFQTLSAAIRALNEPEPEQS